VRVLAATNRDLEAAVASGAFRPELYYRLNVFPVRMPPLRERMDDIPLLVEDLVESFANKAGKRIRHIETRTMQLLQAYDWPGNVRELQNVIERAVVLCDGDTFFIDESWLKRGADRRSEPGGPPRNLPGGAGEGMDRSRARGVQGTGRRPLGRGGEARHSASDTRFEDQSPAHREAAVSRALARRGVRAP
jgi:formate hydrogenlyase transcriptional activator